MKNLLKHVAMLAFTLFLGLAATSCSDDDDKDEPSAVVGKISITNKSTYTLDNFMVNFTNDKGEVITREQKGTLKPSGKVSVEVPIGATYYYMSTAVNGTRFFSVDYAVSVKTQILTDQIVGEWKSN